MTRSTPHNYTKGELLTCARLEEPFVSNVAIKQMVNSIDAAVTRRQSYLQTMEVLFNYTPNFGPYESNMDVVASSADKIMLEEAIIKELFMTLACAMNSIDPNILY